MSRNYCFTYFGEREWDVNEDIRYVVWQREQCPETGRLHCQGYVQFRKQVRLGRACELLGGGLHVEVARGSALRCREYCTKEETRVEGPFEKGIFVQSKGIRTDLQELAIKVMEDQDLDGAEIIKHHKGIEALRREMVPPRDHVTELYVFWGDSRTGKSRLAREMAPNAYWWDDLNWLDGYRGHDDVIIDDFEYTPAIRRKMLRVADRYPLLHPVKGGFVNFCAKRVFITTNEDPKQWPEELRNRVTVCKRFVRGVEPTDYALQV